MAKQLKISTMFKKKFHKIPEDCEDLQEELQQLEQNLKQSQIQLLRVQRDALKRKLTLPKKRDKEFMRPQKIMVTSSIENHKKKLDLYTMLTGMEVKSYVKDEHCCIIYHMQHPASHAIQHGLTINLENGENTVSKYSLPMGFNYNAVMEDYDTVMTPECLRAVWKALVAYYDRLEQVNVLQESMSQNVSIFKIMDGSHVEITFTVHSVNGTDEGIEVTLILDYRVYDIRPKQILFQENDTPVEIINVLTSQCSAFKRDTIADAFRKSFLEGPGPYVLFDEVEQETQEYLHKRPARRPHKGDSDEEYDPNKDM